MRNEHSGTWGRDSNGHEHSDNGCLRSSSLGNDSIWSARGTSFKRQALVKLPFPMVMILYVNISSHTQTLFDSHVQEIKVPWLQGSWGQHGAYLGPTWPRWAPCGPREPCYLGTSFPGKQVIHYTWQASQNDWVINVPVNILALKCARPLTAAVLTIQLYLLSSMFFNLSWFVITF